jgi:hypothetical protein
MARKAGSVGAVSSRRYTTISSVVELAPANGRNTTPGRFNRPTEAGTKVTPNPADTKAKAV